MRRFMQTFVLMPQAENKYYVHNDIFRYQDQVCCVNILLGIFLVISGCFPTFLNSGIVLELNFYCFSLGVKKFY